LLGSENLKDFEVKDRVSLSVLISTKERAVVDYALLTVASLTLFFVSIFYVALALGVITIQNTLYDWFGWGGVVAGSLCMLIPALGLILGIIGTFAGIIGMVRAYSSLRKLKAIDPQEVEKEELKYALRKEYLLGKMNREEYEEKLKLVEERYKSDKGL